MSKFTPQGSLKDFQELIKSIYHVPDDRLFSLFDLLSNVERFTMRALKGIRKNDQDKLVRNCLIGLSWLMSVANRMCIDAEAEVWRRFPGYCSYCGHQPCDCRETKIQARAVPGKPVVAKPQTLATLQVMFEKIYPVKSRSLADAGVHLAEEIGELSEAVHNFLGEHKTEQFSQIELELADCISCFCAVANSADFSLADELSKMYTDNCHVCHQAPCVCNFSYVAMFQS